MTAIETDPAAPERAPADAASVQARASGSESPLVAFNHVALAIADLMGLIVASRVFDLWNRTTVPFVIVSWLLLSRGYTRQRRLVRSAGQDLNQVVSAVGAGTVTAALVAVRTPWVANSLLNAALLAAGLLLLARVVIFGLTRLLRRAGKGAEPTIIVGAGPAAAQFARAVARKKHLGLEIVGFVDHDACDDLPAPYLGEIELLPGLVDRYHARHIILAFSKIGDRELVRQLRQYRDLPVQFHSVSRLFEFEPTDPIACDIDGYPVTSFGPPVTDQTNWRAKRAFDVVVSGGLLLLTAPVLIMCAIAVRLSSTGPILFRQNRVGHGGRPFEILKFRTMEVNDDSETTWTVNRDPRITAVGRVLRPTHLDELPQLWNVLRGDMSVVGPRPERPAFVDKFTATVDGYGDRHRVPAGLTGWAQVNGYWGDSSIEDRARLDNRYIDSWSLWGDVKILARTVPTLFRRSG
jgi:exopolysaccharide biosynthesis polyprenyl glycosylphosphotransferase